MAAVSACSNSSDDPGLGGGGSTTVGDGGQGGAGATNVGGDAGGSLMGGAGGTGGAFGGTGGEGGAPFMGELVAYDDVVVGSFGNGVQGTREVGIELQEGDILRVQVDDPGGASRLNGQLRLFDPTQMLIEEVLFSFDSGLDDAVNILYPVPQTGTYFLTVGGIDDFDDGAYRLRPVEAQANGVDMIGYNSTVIFPTFDSDGSTLSMGMFSFMGGANEHSFIRVAATSTNRPWLEVVLIGPDHTILNSDRMVSSTISNSREDAVIYTQLPVAGEYRVVAYAPTELDSVTDKGMILREAIPLPLDTPATGTAVVGAPQILTFVFEAPVLGDYPFSFTFSSPPGSTVAQVRDSNWKLRGSQSSTLLTGLEAGPYFIDFILGNVPVGTDYGVVVVSPQ